MSNLSPEQFGPYEADCDACGGVHEASYSHEGRYGEGPIFEVPCPVDLRSGFHTLEGVRKAPKKTNKYPLDLR